MVRRLVINAVKDGKMEAMVYSFPSDLCNDRGGRSTTTTRLAGDATGRGEGVLRPLPGARKPQGYRLKAIVINFPRDIPRDIGFFLDSSPPSSPIPWRSEDRRARPHTLTSPTLS